MEDFEKIKELEMIISCINDVELVNIHNEYCEEANYMEDYIHNMAFLNVNLEGKTPTDIIDAIDEVDTNHNYYVDTIHGYKSFNHYYDCPCSCEYDIANYCIRENEDFGNDNIRDWLDQQENSKLMNKLSKTLEETDFIFEGEPWNITFLCSSSAGGDMSFEIESHCFDCMLDEAIEYCENFDPNEEFDVYYRSDLSGVPEPKELWEDCLDKQNKLKVLGDKLADLLNEYLEFM